MRFSSEDLDWAAGIVGRWVPPTTGGNTDTGLLLQVLAGQTPTV
jgi:hypothetical protein